MADANDENAHRVLDGVTREEFAEAAAELRLAKHQTWEPKTEREAYEEVWTTPDKRSAVNYVEDPISGMSYVHFRGPEAEGLLEGLSDKLATFWPEELVERAEVMEDDPEELIANLYRLAITFPAYDEAVFSIFEAAAGEQDARMRLAVLDALAYRRWPEGRELVERLAREDDDAEVRGQAARTLTLWDAPPQP